ncbi:hypothetical protein LTR95_018395 [Oleoguttula sp. CCFEE 5521]
MPQPPGAMLLSHVLPTESIVFDAVEVSAKQLARMSVRATAMSSPDPDLYLDPREVRGLTRRRRDKYEFGSTLSARYVDRPDTWRRERRSCREDPDEYRFGEPYSFEGTATTSLRGMSPDARVTARASRRRAPADDSFMFEKTAESSLRGISPDFEMSAVRTRNEAYQFIRTEQTSLSSVHPHQSGRRRKTGDSSGGYDFEGTMTPSLTVNSDDDYMMPGGEGKPTDARPRRPVSTGPSPTKDEWHFGKERNVGFQAKPAQAQEDRSWRRSVGRVFAQRKQAEK